ncbi:MAG: DUF1934 domain-containing protein [Clostridia bacterium]|nr:DUF1934 domain-containing protein [Clostridia bacterium]
MKCVINIKDTHIIDGDKESAENSVQGNFTFGKESYTIRYKESGEGYEGCFVTLTVQGQKVTMHRKGTLTTEMIIEKGKHHTCAYATPVGIMDLGVYANEVKSDVTENGGELKFSYSLSAGGQHLSENQLMITIKEVDKK